MSDIVDQIKSRLNIVDVVSSYLKLEKSGASFKARCPFHQEKTASFNVSSARNGYYCFGCNKGGDLINFIEEIEAVDFRGALAILAPRAGLSLDDLRHSREENNDKSKLRQILVQATSFYERELGRHAQARSYLRERGLNDESVGAFRIGYAPDSWRALYDHLRAERFPDELIQMAGMTIKSERGGYYDRFRNRIMFPIMDASGSAIAFSGRALPGQLVAGGKDPAKYVNSPETPLYSKSVSIYGFDKAKLAIRKADSAVIVEGQMDLVMSHQAGVTNAVAVSGTAFTNQHLQSLQRLSHNIIMAFDSDVAGFNAARRAIEMALNYGMNVRVALMPRLSPGETQAKDPADLIREKPQLWRVTVEKAQPVIDAILDMLLRRNLAGRHLRQAIETDVLPYLARLSSKLDQAHYVRNIADRLEINEEAVWLALRAHSAQVGRPVLANGASDSPLVGAASAHGRARSLQESLHALIIFAQSLKPAPEWLNDAYKSLQALAQEPLTVPAMTQAKLFEMEHVYGTGDALKERCQILAQELKIELLKSRLTQAGRELACAEKNGDQATSDALAKDCVALSNEIIEAKKLIHES